MKESKKKSIELNIAIGIAAVLLISVMFTLISNKNSQKQPAAKKSIVKEKSPLAIESNFVEQEFEAMTQEAVKKEPEPDKETEEKSEIMLLKDLPLDSISTDQSMPQKKEPDKSKENQDTLEPSFNTQPSIEDVKKLKEKGLVIY